MRDFISKSTERLRQGLQDTKAYADEKGITEDIVKAKERVGAFAGTALDNVGDAFDTAAGKRMYRLVKERMELQDRYNDLLAVKLDEALKRIAVLEAKLHAKE